MEDFAKQEQNGLTTLDESLKKIFSDYEKKKEKLPGHFTSLREYELTKIDKRSIHGGELETISPAEFSNI